MYLFLTEPYLRNQAVKRVQEMLLRCGYDLGEPGVDGVYGKDTMLAVMKFQRTQGIKSDGVVGPQTWSYLERVMDQEASPVSVSDKVVPGTVIDLTRNHRKPRLYTRDFSPRQWHNIDGVTLHQTGCNLSNDPRRWYSLNAHIGVTKNGVILIVNPLKDFIWHAQGFSRNTIGIEFSGNFCGIDHYLSTWWAAGGPCSSLTFEQAKASESLLQYLLQEFSNNGAKFKHVYAHRQSSASRRSDPGSEIWRCVASPWMEETGATDGGPNFRYGSGRPIPKQWCDHYSCEY